jgi:hypothetical protein
MSVCTSRWTALKQSCNVYRGQSARSLAFTAYHLVLDYCCELCSTSLTVCLVDVLLVPAGAAGERERPTRPGAAAAQDNAEAWQPYAAQDVSTPRLLLRPYPGRALVAGV